LGGGVTLATPIAELRLEPLRVIADDRGAVLHMLRADAPLFRGFGEVYLSEIQPGVTKGWKRHQRMTQHLTVPSGRVRFAFFDGRTGSVTHGTTWSCESGRPDAYSLLVIPPGIWYAWRGIAAQASLLVNCTDIPHDPGEADVSLLPEGLGAFEW